jgi:hypothetical protein
MKQDISFFDFCKIVRAQKNQEKNKDNKPNQSN